MVLGDYQRFECAYHLVIASQCKDLPETLRAVELSMGELITILHRIEWDGGTRLFKLNNNRLKLTAAGAEQVLVWGEALRSLGIKI